MRILALLTVLSLAALPVLTLSLSTPAAAQGTRLELEIGVDPQGRTAFVPETIPIPTINITLSVTFRNNFTGPNPQVHTFTIADSTNEAVINTRDVSPNGTVTVEFLIVSLTNISFNGTFFRPEALGGGIRFFCIPHSLTMQGRIVLASAQEPEAEKGILLRAYWIGIIGIAATLLWVGVSYFVIKTSSRHFTDHREHIKRGLP